MTKIDSHSSYYSQGPSSFSVLAKVQAQVIICHMYNSNIIQLAVKYETSQTVKYIKERTCSE